MKLKTLIAAALLTAATSSFAQWFPASVRVNVLPGQVTAQVWNPSFAPIVCSGQVFGRTVHGPVFNAFFAEQILPAGDFRFAFVQTTPFAPFLNGWANIFCRYF